MQVPRVGQFTTVRNRRGIVVAVEPFEGPSGRIYLLQIDFKDDQLPVEEQLLWELEPRARLLEPTELPRASLRTRCRPMTSMPCSGRRAGRQPLRISTRTPTGRWNASRSQARFMAPFRARTFSSFPY